MRQRFCIVTTPRSYSTAVCRELETQLGPAIQLPGPPKVGYELLHYAYLHEVSDLYGIPFNDDERAFIDAYFEWKPASGVRHALASAARQLVKGPATTYVGFKTFPIFHRFNEFFERPDVTFIVLHRRNLDMVFLSWCVALYRNNFEGTFDAKLSDLSFAQIAEREEGLQRLMRDFLFNLRGMSNLISRGAIELVVDENEQVVNNARLDAFFERTIDFSGITHRSKYSALPDMDLFHDRFRELLSFWQSRSNNLSSLAEAFESAYARHGTR